MQNRTAIVIPTYNEAENIGRLVAALRMLYPETKIFIVDDNSPDGTAAIIQKMAVQDEHLKLIWRQKPEGLASAYLDAFARIIPDENLEYIITMDADLSHDPDDLGRLLALGSNYDVVVGSRYIRGGEIENWSWWRKFISRYGNIYTRLVTGAPIHDLTAGFVLYHRETLGRILMHVEEHEPYAFQTEMKFLAWRLGAKIKEAPITFRERTSGKSKLKQSAILEALVFPWYLKLLKKV